MEKASYKKHKVDVFALSGRTGVQRLFDTIWRVPRTGVETGIRIIKYMHDWHRVHEFGTGYDHIIIHE